MYGDRSPGPPARGWQEGVQGKPSAQSQRSRHAGPLSPAAGSALRSRWVLLTAGLGGLAGLQGGDPERQDTCARHLPGEEKSQKRQGTRAACGPPTPPPRLCGFGSSPWVLASLHLFHKLENFRGSSQATGAPGLRPASWGPLAWCLPPHLLFSLCLELLLPPLNLYPVTFKTVLWVSTLAACARRDLESEAILGQC